MDIVKRKTRFAGLLLITGLVAGVFSVAPAIDSAEYLTEAAANSNQVIIGAIFQFIMALAYIGVVILLYPIIKSFGKSLAIGFMSFRVIAATLVIFGTILLLSILALSQEFINFSPQKSSDFEALGNVLKTSRDYVNHVFMILVLCTGNFMFYILLIKSKLIPQWLSVWGLIGAMLSSIASVLVLFRIVDIITPEYMILNVPTALQELILAIWLIVKGLDKKILLIENK
jgi:hypothetical protein